MDKTLRNLWWVPVLKGLAGVAFGILVLTWPELSVSVVAFLFASLLNLYAVANVVSGIRAATTSTSGLLRVLLGFVQLATVIYLFNNGDAVSYELLGLLIAVNLIVISILQTGASLLSEATSGYRWAVGLAALVTLLVSVTAARVPDLNFETLVLALGVFGLFVGTIDVATGVTLKDQNS